MVTKKLSKVDTLVKNYTREDLEEALAKIKEEERSVLMKEFCEVMTKAKEMLDRPEFNWTDLSVNVLNQIETMLDNPPQDWDTADPDSWNPSAYC